MTEKILCIQLAQIGDVLMNTPAIRTLAQNKPNAEIHFLTQSPSQQIFEYNSKVTKVFQYPTKESLHLAIQL